MSRLIIPVRISDKSLHFLAYLLLVFLLWFAISPQQKVLWHKAAVWWILFVVVWYGVIDEWLQAYVARDPDVFDFCANLAGALTGLILLSIFTFWSAALVVAAVAIAFLTGSMQAGSTEMPPLINALILFLSYGFFTAIWVQYIHYYLAPKPPQPRWLIVSLALPIVFLLGLTLVSAASGKGWNPREMIISLIAIIAVVITFFLTTLLKQAFSQKPSRDDV